MRVSIFLLALTLVACSNEPNEEERAAAVAEVEANRIPPPEELQLEPIRYREIEKNELYGTGCSFAPDGGGMSAVALAMAETGHFLRGDKLITLAADKGSPELPYLARRKYDGAAYSMTLDLDEAEGEQSGEETSDYPATLTIRDASEQVVYRKSGIAQCGA
ncbi:MAG TPA: hypothetical protein DEP68_09265 [Erythrobacter sp.]|nr:hypothetical protein [Sphingomonadaceae bacterium]MBG74843.1 hypothetical protein [Erythrobacteraceae bacterium]HCB78948.1 hypothetical protein [Erythrobacter sp.]|tara:strand:+ start:291 stop:776 length:486 start_codon:yes stop_codon:yes gene_type:complete